MAKWQKVSLTSASAEAIRCEAIELFSIPTLVVACVEFSQAGLLPRRLFELLERNPKMPNMSLSRKEAGDLAAYIAEQRR